MVTGRIVAFDPGSNAFGACVMDVGGERPVVVRVDQVNVESGRETILGRRYVEIYDWLDREMTPHISGDLVVMFAMEAPNYVMGNTSGMSTTMESRAPFHMWAWRSCGAGVATIATSELKNALGLKGNAKKNQIPGAAIGMYPEIGDMLGDVQKSQDACDAVGVASRASTLLEGALLESN